MTTVRIAHAQPHLDTRLDRTIAIAVAGSGPTVPRQRAVYVDAGSPCRGTPGQGIHPPRIWPADCWAQSATP
jgi:hypothetical protein